MVKQIINPQILIVVFCLMVASCTKAIDFNQANNFKATPILESSLIYLKESADQFFDNGAETPFIQDAVDITFFDNTFIKNNLIKADFVFETNNSIHRAFHLQIHFLNAQGNLVHEFSITTSASQNNTNIIENNIETFEGSTLAALKSTRKMVFTLRFLSGNPIDENTFGEFHMKSKVILYLNI